MSTGASSLRSVLEAVVSLGSLAGTTLEHLTGLEGLLQQWENSSRAMRDKSVVLTGDFPFNSEDLDALLATNQDVITVDDSDSVPLLPPVDLVVIGREGFSRELLSALAERGGTTQFLTQEAFIDLFLFGHSWWENPRWLEEMVDCHDGIAFVLEVRGALGAIEPIETLPPTGEISHTLNSTSFLSEMGYSAAIDGPSEETRRHILRQAAAQHGKGLVTWYLEGFIDLASKRQDPPRQAIQKWERDLMWISTLPD